MRAELQETAWLWINLLNLIWFADFMSYLLTSPCGRQRGRRCWGEDSAAPSALLLFRCYHQVVFLFLVSTPSDSRLLVLWRRSRFSVGVSALCRMKSLPVRLSAFWFFLLFHRPSMSLIFTWNCLSQGRFLIFSWALVQAPAFQLSLCCCSCHSRSQHLSLI